MCSCSRVVIPHTFFPPSSRPPTRLWTPAQRISSSSPVPLIPENPRRSGGADPSKARLQNQAKFTTTTNTTITPVPAQAAPQQRNSDRNAGNRAYSKSPLGRSAKLLPWSRASDETTPPRIHACDDQIVPDLSLEPGRAETSRRKEAPALASKGASTRPTTPPVPAPPPPNTLSTLVLGSGGLLAEEDAFTQPNTPECSAASSTSRSEEEDGFEPKERKTQAVISTLLYGSNENERAILTRRRRQF